MYNLHNLDVRVSYISENKEFMVEINVFGGLSSKELYTFAKLDKRVNVDTRQADFVYYFKEDAFIQILPMGKFLDKLLQDLNTAVDFVENGVEAVELYVDIKNMSKKIAKLEQRIKQLENDKTYDWWWNYPDTVTVTTTNPKIVPIYDDINTWGSGGISDNCNTQVKSYSCASVDYEVNGKKHKSAEVSINGKPIFSVQDGDIELQVKPEELAKTIQKEADEVTKAVVDTKADEDYSGNCFRHDTSFNRNNHTGTARASTLSDVDK